MRKLVGVGNLVGVVAIMALAACGGGGETTEKTKTTTTNKTTTSTPATNGAAGKAAAPTPDSTDTLSGATLAQFTGNATAGQSAFVVCQSCHVVQPGVNRIGPSLAGIVGRRAGTIAGFSYTPANRDSGITWTAEKLFQYLENPARVVPGTKMAFAGIPDPQRRADVIAYLAAQAAQ